METETVKRGQFFLSKTTVNILTPQKTNMSHQLPVQRLYCLKSVVFAEFSEAMIPPHLLFFNMCCLQKKALLLVSFRQHRWKRAEWVETAVVTGS